ncbi:MAG: di-trans,poly-cis-decaprenylcistransferase, partial [Oscillospiraceae bacterium]|nr:di-trans,poly-cis-decaprenylcistransferase [Oscillospiraceae bacterium]
FGQSLDEVASCTGQRYRRHVLGDKAPFPDELRFRMEKLEKDSAPYDGMTLLLAMNYGGRDDIVHAARELAALCRDGDITPNDIDEKTFEQMLYTGSAPGADLIIRTGGEERISNFLLWQSAYAEFYFTDVLWPDFNEKELRRAFEEYARRDRRFGGVKG